MLLSDWLYFFNIIVLGLESRRKNLGLELEVGARKIQAECVGRSGGLAKEISLVVGQDIEIKWIHRTDRVEYEMRGSTGKENGISTWSQRQGKNNHAGRDETGGIKEGRKKQEVYSVNQ